MANGPLRSGPGLRKRVLLTVCSAVLGLPQPLVSAPVGQVQPVWLEVLVPPTAAPGAYEGKLRVQTTPPEGTVVPAGPRCIIVRGLTTPGARVTLNGKTIQNVRPSGYFFATDSLDDAKPLIRVGAEQGGKQRTVERLFTLTD